MEGKDRWLAGSLFALSITLPLDLRKPFLCSKLHERIIKELTVLRAESVCWAEALSILGSAAALGLRIDAVDAHWPNSKELASIIELRIPDAGRGAIEHIQAQLWLGIREMARLRNDSISVPAEHADKILTLWCNTNESEEGNTLPAHVREANAHMIAWLEQCKKEGWCLVRDAER